MNPDASLKEKSSGAINLKDEPEFADAVDCMMEYFYRAGYDTAKYDASIPLLHARVAAIADKYGCASLYELAKTSLAGCIETAVVEDWVEIAALVYSCMTTELVAHKDLRSLVVLAVPGYLSVPESFSQHSSVEELLRSTADLGADLLLLRTQRTVRLHIFTCDHCHYTHAGSAGCSIVACDDSGLVQSCPICQGVDGVPTKRYVKRIRSLQAQPCPSCEGVHNQSSQDPPPPEPADAFGS